eukprot:GHVH01012964.1.p1 GENE.GHVH01012964.1~~GHVH01012964.1.p1  ORF type:complete len:394 (-),score=71.01 GHVH01012964.1:2091-3182(-)
MVEVENYIPKTNIEETTILRSEALFSDSPSSLGGDSDPNDEDTIPSTDEDDEPMKLSVSMDAVRYFVRRFHEVEHPHEMTYTAMKERYLSEDSLPKFHEYDEEKFDDYFEALSDIHKEHRIPVELMKRFCREEILVRPEGDTTSFEVKSELDEAIEDLALSLFRTNRYYCQRLEQEVYNLKPEPTVPEAVGRSKRLIIRTTRAGLRKNRQLLPGLDEELCREILLRALPPQVRELIELEQRRYSFDMPFYQMEREALAFEKEVNRPHASPLRRHAPTQAAVAQRGHDDPARKPSPLLRDRGRATGVKEPMQRVVSHTEDTSEDSLCKFCGLADHSIETCDQKSRILRRVPNRAPCERPLWIPE